MRRIIRSASALWIASCLPAVAVTPPAPEPWQEAIITAGAPAEAPVYHGPAVLGARGNSAWFHAFTVAGRAPLTVQLDRVPAGLTFDSTTGILSGKTVDRVKVKLKLTATNAAGSTEFDVQLNPAGTPALTPPRGWNSFDAYGDSVTEAEILENARVLKEKLAPYGWDTVVVDYRWYDPRADSTSSGTPKDPAAMAIDAQGRYLPATNRFPSCVPAAGFKPLADQIHAMGLKFGLHIMRGIPRRAVEQKLPIEGSTFTADQAVRDVSDPDRTCVWNADMYGVNASTDAGKAWYRSIAKQYAAWGIDYLKVDDISRLGGDRPATARYAAEEIAALHEALRDCGRQITLSLSPGETPLSAASHVKTHSHLWRISGDLWDEWKGVNHAFDLLAQWAPHASPGAWPDPDMIPLGHLAIRSESGPDRWTRLTPREQHTLITLWTLAPAPLMLGMRLADNDPWTLALLTHPEVLAIHQTAEAVSARPVFQAAPGVEVWSRPLDDTTWAVGVFNRTDAAVTVKFAWANAGLPESGRVRDVWLRQDLPRSLTHEVTLEPHASQLLRVTK